MTSEPILLAAAQKQPTPRLPIWMMRQAGRYLPEYRAVREKHSFLEMARIPELATEITLQPTRRFQLDGAIIFSDILVVPEALGFPYEIVEASGPQFERPFEDTRDIENMKARVADIPHHLSYFYSALRMLRQQLPLEARAAGRDTPALLGFAGAPFTLATYLIEGRSKTDHQRTQCLARTNRKLFQELLFVLEDAVGLHLVEQARAGAQMVQLFESFAHLLPQPLFQEFCVAPAKRIIDRVRRETGIPVSYFSRGAGGFLKNFSQLGADVYSIDWATDLTLARSVLGNDVCLQGNLDPIVLLTTPQCVEQETRKVLETLVPGAPHIFNLGHGILPKTPLENVEAMFRTVREYKISR